MSYFRNLVRFFALERTHYDLKVSHVNVQLPVLKSTPLNMLVVYGDGNSSLKLLTNREVKGKKDVLSVLKAYIPRWRIEELFHVQKEEFHLENTYDVD